MINFVAELW